MTMIISGSTGLEFPDGSDQTTAAVATTPGGSNTYVQYNNAGVFGGSASFVFDGTNVGIGTASPSEKLEVAGNLKLNNGSADGGQLSLSSSGYSDWNIDNYSGSLRNYYGATVYTTLTSSGNFGIGTSSPSCRLDLNRGSAGLLANFTDGVNTNFQIETASLLATIGPSAGSTGMAFKTGNTERMRISAAGGLSVGTTADPGAGAIYATGNITAYYSDDRLKTKLGGIENALDKVKFLSGFYYEANQTAQDLGYQAVREVGVSAQQVQAVMPEVVKPAPIDQQYLTVDYERLVPLLIEAIKELEEKVAKLEAK